MPKPKIIASVIFYAEGGRTTKPDLRSGKYMPHLVVEEDYLGVRFVSAPKRWDFGKVVNCTIELMYAYLDTHPIDYSELIPNATFVIKEGGKSVGSGIVVNIPSKKKTKCFWCQKEKGLTKDHLVSRPLAKFLGIARPHWRVQACSSCNNERGKISGALSELIKLRADGNFDQLDHFWKTRADALPVMMKFRPLLVDRLLERKSILCCKEIDELL